VNVVTVPVVMDNVVMMIVRACEFEFQGGPVCVVVAVANGDYGVWCGSGLSVVLGRLVARVRSGSSTVLGWFFFVPVVVIVAFAVVVAVEDVEVVANGMVPSRVGPCFFRSVEIF
jgi:hypothetical protein